MLNRRRLRREESSADSAMLVPVSSKLLVVDPNFDVPDRVVSFSHAVYDRLRLPSVPTESVKRFLSGRTRYIAVTAQSAQLFKATNVKQ